MSSVSGSPAARADCFGCWVVSWPPGTRPVPEPVWLLGEHWTLNHRELGELGRPCWVLQSRRHLADLDGASPQELAAFGPALAQASAAVRAACEADRVYVQLTNKRGHYHLDLVPHYSGEPESDTGLLAGRQPPSGVLRRELPALLERVGELLAAGPLPVRAL